MITGITHTTILVDDVDEAIAWYTNKLGFELRNDEEYAPDQRWVTVAPQQGTTELVLQTPNGPVNNQSQSIGNGTMTVLAVDNCQDTIDTLEEMGVPILSGPEEVPWGIHAVIADPYGNPFNLVEQT